jgi:[ribosomal protein S5]-alanine N-acetyltransferase
MVMPSLETERLLVRPFRPDDLEMIHHILDVDLQFVENGEPPRSLGQRKSWLEWTIAGYEEFAALYQPPYGERAIVRREDDRLIGACGVVPAMGPFAQLGLKSGTTPPRETTRYSPEVGLFWALASTFWGRGYATEAAAAIIKFGFDQMNLRRMIATTEYTNARSQAVMERVGMRLEKNPFPEPAWFQVIGILENSASESSSSR